MTLDRLYATDGFEVKYRGINFMASTTVEANRADISYGFVTFSIYTEDHRWQPVVSYSVANIVSITPKGGYWK